MATLIGLHSTKCPLVHNFDCVLNINIVYCWSAAAMLLMKLLLGKRHQLVKKTVNKNRQEHSHRAVSFLRRSFPEKGKQTIVLTSSAVLFAVCLS